MAEINLLLLILIYTESNQVAEVNVLVFLRNLGSYLFEFVRITKSQYQKVRREKVMVKT